MAEFTEWGAERSGVRIAEKDILDRALQQLQMREVQERIPIYAAHARLYDAQAREKEQKTKAAEQEAAALQAWAQGRGQAGGTAAAGVEGQQEQLVNGLFGLAELRLSQGKLDDAREVASAISQIQGRDALRTKRVEETEKLTYELGQSKNKLAVQLGRGAKSQGDWDLARRMYEQQTGETSPIFAQPFNPAARDRLVQGLLTEAEAARIVYQDKIVAEQQKRTGLAGARLALDTRIADERLALATRRQTQLEKVGEKSEKAPSPAERDAVNAIIKQEFPDIDPTNMRVAGTSVISEAKRLLRGNKGLTLQQALSQSFNSQREDFQQEAGVTDPFFGTSWGKKRVTFTGTGRRPSEALAMPDKQEKAIVGKYYKTTKGILRYEGEGRFSSPEPDDDDNED